MLRIMNAFCSTDLALKNFSWIYSGLRVSADIYFLWLSNDAVNYIMVELGLYYAYEVEH